MLLIKNISICVVFVCLFFICNATESWNTYRFHDWPLERLTKPLLSNNSNSKGFVFTTTWGLRVGRRETACLSLYGINADSVANVTVTIAAVRSHVTTVTRKTIEAEDAGCFEIRVPNTQSHHATLRLQIKFSNDPNYVIDTKEYVELIQNANILVIQTDKEVYKPGDRVKIRVLVLTKDLTVPKNLMISIVRIKNPAFITIGQWESISTHLGFVQLEHQLSQETMLGDWTIGVEYADNYKFEKTFQVKEYTLERFEIILKHPKSMYYEENSIIASVCAKYTYGMPIKGSVNIELRYPNNHLYKTNITELDKGCANFEIVMTEPFEKDTYWGVRGILLSATVIERDTGYVKLSNSTIDVYFYKNNMEFVNIQSFKPNIPFKGQLKINNADELWNKSVQICYNIAIVTSWNLTDLKCSKFSINESNLIDFVILPFGDNLQKMEIMANIEDDDLNKITITKNVFYSSSENYIHISHESKLPMKCKSWQSFTILYTLDKNLNNGTKYEPIVFHYLIKSKGNIMKIGKVSHTPCSAQPFRVSDYNNILGETSDSIKPSKLLDTLILTIKINQKMYANGELFVYYVRKDREVIAGNIEFEVEKCVPNKVETKWSSSKKYPGEEVNLKIKAASGSLCSVSVIDRLTRLQSPAEQLTMDKLLRMSKKPNVPFDYSMYNCVESKPDYERSVLIAEEPPYWDLKRRRKRFQRMRETPSVSSDYEDVANIFSESGLFILSDLKTISRPCYMDSITRSEPSPVSANMYYSPGIDKYRTEFIDTGAKIRHYFPESWLWELVPVGRTGEIQLKKELPHSITQWIGNTICISPSAGVGIGAETYITTIKPFFIDLITPYSLKRNEISHLKTIVFNYLNYSLPVRISITTNENIRLAGPPDEHTTSACIGANDSIAHIFRISALALGKVNISVTAEVDAAFPSECGPEVLLNRKDVILKTVVVQPEGFPFENIRSTISCANVSENGTKTELKWNMELPHDAVKNSSRIKVILDTDLLELTIENLGILLKIPNGCGEQIMATLAPNYYVLRYLNATKNLTTEIKTKALNNIRQGYERILNYKHMDYSFSAFGEKYGPGSMFLSAFVLRTLSQASSYVFVDKTILLGAAHWIIEKQLENGCFPATSHEFQAGMSESDDNVALTAYVLISLMESNSSLPVNVKQNVRYCLSSYNSLDKYTMAIVTYAQSLAGWEEEANRTLERLLEVGSRHNGLTWWEDTESMSSSVETTAYAIMSLLRMQDAKHPALAKSAVRWLLTKRNSRGGFISTQDTVVALDAMTKFAVMTKQEKTNLNISIDTIGKTYNYRIKSSAKLKTKQITLPQFSKYIHFALNGTGCILIQTIIRYNMPEITSSLAFKLNVSTSSVSNVDKCSIASVHFCLSYDIIGKHVNMAVLEVTLPSGYKGDRTSLFQLVEIHSKIKRFEESEDKVIFYLTNLDDEKSCLSFLIKEQTIVENRTEAIVRLYDYYNPTLSEYKSYQLPECFSTIININETDEDDTNSIEINTSEDYLDYLQDFPYNSRENNLKQPYRTRLNPDFVDMDVKMEVPEGVEGPKQVYVKAPNNYKHP